MRRVKVHYNELFNYNNKGLTLRQRAISFHQRSEGLRSAYEELGLGEFEQIIIMNFLEAFKTKLTLRLAWECHVNKKKAGASLEEFLFFLNSQSQSSNCAFGVRKIDTAIKKGHTMAATKLKVVNK